MKKLIVSILSVSLLFVGGCKQEKVEKKDRIGFTIYDQYDTYINELVDDFNKEIATYGNVSLESFSAKKSQKTQNKQVRHMIENGCDVLIVNPVDRTEPTKIIDMAKKSDVPVIFFNREPVEEDLAKWSRLYYVGANGEQSGVMQGEIAIDAFRKDPTLDKNKDGVIQYYMLEGEAGHQDAILRTERSVDTIVTSGFEVDKVGSAIANWNSAQAQSKITQYLEQGGEQIELLLANNDDMALGAIQAYVKAEIPKEEWPLIIGVDGTKEGLKAVNDGDMYGTVYTDQKSQAKVIADLAIALCNEEDLSRFEMRHNKYLRFPFEAVTQKNVHEYLH